MPTIEDALSYLQLGYSIIPTKPDKRPLIPTWTRYQKTLPTEDEVRKWWIDFKTPNIALITGKVSDIVVIDIDGPDGVRAYNSIFGELHNTISQKTGKLNARHLFFKYPKDGNGKLGNTVRHLSEVDTRADGGYAIIPPSVHQNGKKYEWIIDPRNSPDDLMDLPLEVRAYFWPTDTSKPAEKVPLDVQSLLMGVEEGRRDDACTRLAGYYLRAFTGDIQQTEQVLELWNTRNNPPLDWKTVKKCVASIAKKQGREEMGEQTGAFIRELEKHVYPDGTYKYAVYPQNKEGFFLISSKDLADQAGFIVKYMEAVDYKLPRIKGKDWDSLLNKLLKEIKIIQISEDETPIGQIMEILRAETMRPLMDLTGLDTGRIVCENVNNGAGPKLMVYFKIKSILDRIKTSGERMSAKEAGSLLRRMNAQRKVINVGGNLHTVFSIGKEKI